MKTKNKKPIKEIIIVSLIIIFSFYVSSSFPDSREYGGIIPLIAIFYYIILITILSCFVSKLYYLIPSTFIFHILAIVYLESTKSGMFRMSGVELFLGIVVSYAFALLLITGLFYLVRFIKKEIKEKKAAYKAKHTAPKYIRLLVYFSYFYFGIRLIFSVFFFFVNEVKELFGLFNLIFNLAVILLGLFLAYNLMKMRKRALVWLMVIIALNIASILYWSYALGNTKLPIVPIVYLILLFNARKYLDTTKNKIKKCI